MAEPTKFLTNEDGERTAVVISIEESEKLLADLEEQWAIREYDEAKAASEIPVPFEEAVARIEQKRNRTSRETAGRLNDSVRAKINALAENPRPVGC